MPLSRLKPSSLLLATIGSLLVFGSVLWYQIGLETSTIVASSEVGVLEEMAYATLVSIFVGLLLAFWGLSEFIRQTRPANGVDSSSLLIGRLSMIVQDKRSMRVFVYAAFAYGLLFAIVSSTLVFQPSLTFSRTYGVSVPSIVPVVCCGSFGLMPQFVIYFTQQFAVLIVPENLVLLCVLSWLVGLNAATVNYAYTSRAPSTGTRWIVGLGALFGLFTICPTCAGLFFLATVGLGSAVALTVTFSSLQSFFIAVGIPTLLLAPVVATRRMFNGEACPVKVDDQPLQHVG
jgi:hypothetical protein